MEAGREGEQHENRVWESEKGFTSYNEETDKQNRHVKLSHSFVE